MLSVIVWSAAFVLPSSWQPPPHWHAHEMLAGFLYPAVAGFLLTAVCNWTGCKPLNGKRLASLWFLWLIARACWLAGFENGFVSILDLTFLPLIIASAGLPILRVQQWRQLPLLLALSLLWLSDLAFHLSGDARWLHLGVELAALLVLLVAARITPAFSRNWLHKMGQDPQQVRDSAALGNMILLSFLLLITVEAVTIAGTPLPANGLISVFALITATLISWRLLLWRGWLVFKEPLLWILHLGAAWVVVGLMLRAGNESGLITASAWRHALGAGALGTMILGVISRVSLGHTGRTLSLPAGMKIAFVLVITAAIVRVSTALTIVNFEGGLLTSTLCWTGAFALFLIRYSPILTQPRIDGRSG